MFLNKKALKPYKVRKHETKKTHEGATVKGYADEPIIIKAEIWPAGGKVQAELFGQRLNYILNANVEPDADIAENDGFCIDSDQVTHKVISVKQWTYHKQLELQDVRYKER